MTDPSDKDSNPKQELSSKTANELAQAMFGMNIDPAQLMGMTKKQHKFWNKQPVPQDGSETSEHGPLDVEKTVDEVRATPLNLPGLYEWVDVDMSNPADVDDLYNLLNLNYVEDDDNMFRFDYSRDFLQWALTPPGYLRQWHTCVRVKSSKKLVAFISAIPADVLAYDKKIPMVEINFLCIHKKLRNKRLAPVLIREITRRVNRENRWQAVYTAGVVLPKPVGRTRYWHRSINPKKLISVGFSHLAPHLTMSATMKLYRLPDSTAVPGLRQMEERDCEKTRILLQNFLNKFDLRVNYSLDEFKHWFMPREGVIYSYVVEDPETKEITDMISFYSLPSTIIGHDTYKSLNAAYSFYNVATSQPWKVLMKDALVLARNEGFDVFNALDVMENTTFFKELKFGIGDGNLQYYLYNWGCPEMAPDRVGLVLL